MNIITITNYLKKKNELELLKAEIEKIQESLIEQMEGKETVICGQYKLTYKDVSRRDIDRKALEEKYPEIAKEFEKVTSYKRFSAK